MPESLTIAAFVFGAILVLLALVGGGFKLFGAEVPGKAGRFSRVVAFVMGSVFLLIGIALQVAPDSFTPKVDPTNPEKKEQVRDVKGEAQSPASEMGEGDQKKEALDIPISPTVNIEGTWHNREGQVYVIRQNGNTYTSQTTVLVDDYYGGDYLGEVSVRGKGLLEGYNFTSTYDIYASINSQYQLVATGSGSGRISEDGMVITGSFYDPLSGSYHMKWTR